MNWHFGFSGVFSFALEDIAAVQKLDIEVPGGPIDHRAFPVSVSVTFRQPIDFFEPTKPIVLPDGEGAIRPVSWHSGLKGFAGLVSVVLIEGLAAESFLDWWRQRSDTYWC